MKITRAFAPLTITIETSEELEKLKCFLHAATNLYLLEHKDYSDKDVQEVRHLIAMLEVNTLRSDKN